MRPNDIGVAVPVNRAPAPAPVPGTGEGARATVPACGVLVQECRYTPGDSLQARDDHSKFFLVLAGHARWECGGRRYMVGPNTICHVPAGQPHSQETLPGNPVLAYALHFRPELLAPAVRSQLSDLGLVPLDLDSTAANQERVVRALFQEMLFEQNTRQEGWEVVLHSRLMDLAVRILRLVRRRSRHELPAVELGNDSIERVARYALRLKTQFFRQETVTDAARAVGLSRRQFTELFRKATGQSWRRYVLGLRLKHAAELLAETNRSVSAVAFESGFEDLSNFHHSFKVAYGCSPLSYREQRRVRLPVAVAAPAPPPPVPSASGFKLRGMKGWFWTPEQYLQEIPTLASLQMNFLMSCYGSMMVSRPGGLWCNEWWKPLPGARKEAYSRIIRSCREHGITFCFALHPQLASPRPLVPGQAKDLNLFYQHYAWAQEQGVQWFSLCLDGTIWGPKGPAASGAQHAALVNAIFERLQSQDPKAQLAMCPVACWGDATNPEHRAYLETLARLMHPEVYVFWNGDSIVTPRVTRVAAESFQRAVNHRLLLWDNYPVNDGSPTLHLGPLSGREPDLCEVIDGYLSNPMCRQNEINRLPLATCADYAAHPRTYNPGRSISQAIGRNGQTAEQQQLLKELVEAYPGFIVAGGGTGTNPVRAKFGSLLAEGGARTAARQYLERLRGLHDRLGRLFPGRFTATRQTLREDRKWMEIQLERIG